MLSKSIVAAAVVGQAAAFPWVADQIGHPRDFYTQPEKRYTEPSDTSEPYGSAARCPNNPKHEGAVPFNPKYPYCGAQNGLPGYQFCINNLVPAKGDTAHYYTPPGPDDIRGPCPGINTAANHNFLSHDGITTFEELVDMQQNVYGVGYGLAVFLATLGVVFDGDPVSGKLSIGCDATSRTDTIFPGPELGLDGHNKFEGDSSLTRDDYFLADGDNYSFNNTKFERMSDLCQGNFDQKCMANYRYNRYQESLNWNGNFYFGVKSLLLYGAASFVYELFPSYGNAGKPSQMIENYFFQQEKIPPNWFSRETPYTLLDVIEQINQQYSAHPVAFGGNTGKPNTFEGFPDFGAIKNGKLDTGSPAGTACLLYQIATGNIPSFLGVGGNLIGGETGAKYAASKLNPFFGNSSTTLGSFGCPLAYNDA